jgi:hypothetical protein
MDAASTLGRFTLLPVALLGGLLRWHSQPPPHQWREHDTTNEHVLLDPGMTVTIFH